MKTQRSYSLFGMLVLLSAYACASVISSPAAAQDPRAPSASAVQRPQTLYVANAGTVSGNAIYGYSLKRLALTYQTTSKLDFPQGIATDSNGDLFVANTFGYNVLKFEPPKTDPTLVVEDREFRPDDVAIDSNANIWVANFCTRDERCGPGNVREYSSAGTLLQTIRCPNIARYYFLAVDGKNDVVVAGEGASKGGAASEIADGTAACVPLPKVSITFPGGVQFTENGDLSVTDQSYAITYTYAKPSFSTILYVTDLLGIPSPAADAFEKGDAYHWYAVAGYNGVFQFPYPAGGYPSNSLTGFSFPTGVAIGVTR
ncbi:MAG: hypothetical protein WB757_02475 [Candidatus Cybelea sp.]|jgi:hypothetical protein